MNKQQILTIVAASLGYFVDIYDLLLFGIVRVSSLKDIGVPEEELLSQGVLLINLQMAGLLLGGLVWGILGDRKGRLSVLFGSILMYSLANLANAFVTSVEAYGFWRFVAGIGLAGELGAGITLVAEILPKEKRGYGTTIVASVGILGAVFGGLVGDLTHWRTAYIIGGVLGLSLLFFRLGIMESKLFDHAKSTRTDRGAFLRLLEKENLWKYLRCIFIGVPIWYVIGILILFSPEFGRALGLNITVSAGAAVMWSYLGLALGDLSSGLLSQWLQSRRKAVLCFLVMTLVFVGLYLLQPQETSTAYFYFLCTLLGFGTGYWAVFVTVGAEQFGTNIRATAATTIPNFVRGAVVPITMSFEALTQTMSLAQSAALVGTVCFGFAFVSLYYMEETFKKDLNFHS